MAEHVLMTALSPTMEEGTIVSWVKKEGDDVAAGDVLCEVETDKATMDYESTQEGRLLKVIRSDGSSARVGDVIAIMGEDGEDISGLIETSSVAAAQTPAPAERKDAAVVQPAATEAPAPADVAPSETGGARVKASPLARRIAVDRGIDITLVPGSGPQGRVVKRDIEQFSPAAASVGESAGAQPAHDVRIPVAGIRAIVARRLSESMFSAPHYYLKSTVQMDSALAARKQLNSERPERAGFNAFLIKFVAEALKKHPGVNASWQGDHILQFGSIDIGLAVDLGNGLITPIVRNCGNRGIVEIDRELKILIDKAGDGKLMPEDYTGATFTISNLGSFGVEEFTAVINPPGSAILAVGKVARTVVVGENDEITATNVMKMTLSCDHRVIDGAVGGRFLQELTGIIENPVRALF